MKVFQATLSYFDGDHDHGQYASPIFSKEDDCKKFIDKITSDSKSPEFWGTFFWDDYKDDEEYKSKIRDNIVISRIEIVDEFDGNVTKSDDYLTITYT